MGTIEKLEKYIDFDEENPLEYEEADEMMEYSLNDLLRQFKEEVEEDE